MGADEAGRPGYEDFHFTAAYLMSRNTARGKSRQGAADKKNPKLPLECPQSARIGCNTFPIEHPFSMKIKAYLKPSCGWSNGVRAIMRKHNLAYEDIDIINNRVSYEEMVRKSGQPLLPCVEIDGVMHADISGEEVENYLQAHDLVKPNNVTADAPTNA